MTKGTVARRMQRRGTLHGPPYLFISEKEVEEPWSLPICLKLIHFLYLLYAFYVLKYATHLYDKKFVAYAKTPSGIYLKPLSVN